MELEDRAPDEREANLEFWSGRARAEDPVEVPARPARSFGARSGAWRAFRVPPLRFPRLRRPTFTRPTFTRPSFRRPAWTRPALRLSGRGRLRPIAAAVLLAGLAAAWLVVGHRSHASAGAELTPRTEAPSSAPVRTTSTAGAPVLGVEVPPVAARRTPDCRGLSGSRPEVTCVVDRVELDIRLYASGTAAEAYTRATGAPARPGAGAPACDRGVPDERSWSEASAPTVGVGRYRCRFEHGRAAMWWTHGDRLAHAVGPDHDLAALFAWWRVHPSE
jgi:hypothetical protein